MFKLKPITPARLKTWRITRGLQPHQAAKLFHVSRKTWYLMENRRITNPYIMALAVYALDLIGRLREAKA